MFPRGQPVSGVKGWRGGNSGSGWTGAMLDDVHHQVEPDQSGDPAVGANQPRRPLLSLMDLMIKFHSPDMKYCYSPGICI